MKTEISRIKVMERIRKEINNIDMLAKDIQLNGLLNPVTVMKLSGGELQLLAGLRRLKAVQMLGWADVDVNVVSPADADAALRIEYSENVQREDFTFSEMADYSRLIEAVEGAKAKERMLAGKKIESTDPVPPGGQGSVAEQGGRVRDVVASALGVGKSTADRIKYLANNAPQEIIDEHDRGERSIRGTYDELRAKERDERTSSDELLSDKGDVLIENQTEENLLAFILLLQK